MAVVENANGFIRISLTRERSRTDTSILLGRRSMSGPRIRTRSLQSTATHQIDETTFQKGFPPSGDLLSLLMVDDCLPLKAIFGFWGVWLAASLSPTARFYDGITTHSLLQSSSAQWIFPRSELKDFSFVFACTYYNDSGQMGWSRVQMETKQHTSNAWRWWTPSTIIGGESRQHG
jgi:hypothetical protein